MPLPARRLLVGTVTAALLGLVPAVAGATAAETAAETAAPPVARVAPTAAVPAPRRGDQGSIVGRGGFNVRLSNTSTGLISVRWSTRTKNKYIRAWRITTSTSRTLTQHATTYTIKRTKRSATVRHASLVTPASGDYTFVKLSLVRRKGTPRTWSSGTLWIKAPVTTVPSATSTRVTVGTFNIHTWNSEPAGYKFRWADRGPRVASTIKTSGADVIGLQEASGGLNMGYGNQRQWTAVENSVGAPWKLTEDDQYRLPNNVADGRQGTRILYNSDKLQLVEHRHFVAGIPMPKETVWIAEARFEKLDSGGVGTGVYFSVLSAHLIQKESLNAQRVAEAITIDKRINQIRQAHPTEQVVLVGDMNSTIYSTPDNGVHRELVQLGYYDAFATNTLYNSTYPTTNSYVFPVQPSPHRRDYIMTKGPTAMRGSSWYRNVFYNSASQAASDHYLQLASVPIG